MYRSILSFVISFGFCIASASQTTNRTLFIIDSIPLINDPEEWNPISQEDIADLYVLKNKDSLKLLGWEQFDGVIYVFTKAYRNRPDSIKKIPSLKQMVMKEDVWHLHDIPYSGKYIDYYNNGQIQNEGNLLNGKLEGELIIYFRNGNKKSVADYKNGVLLRLTEYYKNGALWQTREYANGKQKGRGKTYFINGQIEYELRSKKETRYDTSVTYYSTGKIKKMKVIQPGQSGPDKEEQDLGYYNTYFYQSINEGDIKKANKMFYQIWLRDSGSTETYFREGLLMQMEYRFDEAIASYDQALEIEPLMREALAHRALARIKKYKYPNAKTMSKDRRQSPLVIDDIILIPHEEQMKICNDLRLAEYVDHSEFYIMKIVPGVILNYCTQMSH